MALSAVGNYERISTAFSSAKHLLRQILLYDEHVIRWNYSQVYSNEEKAMAPHSSTLAWKIPWLEEPGRLQSMGSLRVGHD